MDSAWSASGFHHQQGNQLTEEKFQTLHRCVLNPDRFGAGRREMVRLSKLLLGKYLDLTSAVINRKSLAGSWSSSDGVPGARLVGGRTS